jgi:hypothetical protein
MVIRGEIGRRVKKSAVKRKEEENYNEIKQNKEFRLIMLP